MNLEYTWVQSLCFYIKYFYYFTVITEEMELKILRTKFVESINHRERIQAGVF